MCNATAESLLVLKQCAVANRDRESCRWMAAWKLETRKQTRKSTNRNKKGSRVAVLIKGYETQVESCLGGHDTWLCILQTPGPLDAAAPNNSTSEPSVETRCLVIQSWGQGPWMWDRPDWGGPQLQGNALTKPLKLTRRDTLLKRV